MIQWFFLGFLKIAKFVGFIIKALCLGFEHIQNLGQIHFQIMEQNLVQHYETRIKDQACKASLCGMRPCLYCVKALGNFVDFGPNKN